MRASTIWRPAASAAPPWPLPCRRSAAPRRRPRRGPQPSPPVLNPVMQWNQFLLDLQATPGAQPATVHPTYDLAIVHTAIYDAAVSIDHAAPPYLVRARAGRGSASTRPPSTPPPTTRSCALYPAQRPRSTSTTRRRCAPADGARQIRGHRASAGASRRRSSRSAPSDGSAATPARPSSPGPSPGDYQLTPPALTPPVFTHWPRVKPFLLRRANQFRPPAPPALTSAKYAAALERGQGARLRRRLDPHARPDADRPVLEPADLGGLEPDRPDCRARPPQRPVAERAHVRSARTSPSRTPSSPSTTPSTPTASGVR